MLKDHEDAFGHAMYDHLHGKGGFEIIERDDGYITPGLGPEMYFQEHAEWLDSEVQALTHVHGRVLDVGCGAGRHALYLQGLGFDVIGVDVSPLAIRTCQERGLRKTLIASVTQLSSKLGTFDTILMMGNNFCLAGNPRRALWLLKRFYGLTNPSGRIIAQTRDIYQTDEPDHLAYHQHNIQRGRMAGELRLCVRYKKYKTPWFDLLYLSTDELHDLLSATRWVAREIIEDPGGTYVAIIEKK